MRHYGLHLLALAMLGLGTASIGYRAIAGRLVDETLLSELANILTVMEEGYG